MATVERKDRRGARPLVAVLAALALCWAFAALVSVSAYSATGDVANLGKLEKRQLTGFRFGKPEETEEGDDDSALTGERSLVDWTPYAGSSGKRPRLPVNIKKRTTKRRRRTTRKKLGAGKTTSKRWTTSKRRTTSRRLAGPAATSRAPVKTTARPASVCPVYPVATDGMCGTATGKKCPSPYCCSSTGFCGLGDAWCGTGCQLGGIRDGISEGSGRITPSDLLII